jgi:hypothetical protein
MSYQYALSPNHTDSKPEVIRWNNDWPNTPASQMKPDDQTPSIDTLIPYNSAGYPWENE